MMHFRFGKFFCAATLLLLGLGTGFARAEADAEQQATVNKAVESVSRFAADPDMQWFRNNVGKAKGCLVVRPHRRCRQGGLTTRQLEQRPIPARADDRAGAARL
jgi:hypothetical protein